MHQRPDLRLESLSILPHFVQLSVDRSLLLWQGLVLFANRVEKLGLRDGHIPSAEYLEELGGGPVLRERDGRGEELDIILI